MCGLAGLWRPTAAPADELEAHSLAMADASPIAAQWAAQIATGGLGTDVLPLPVAVGAAFPGIASPAVDWPSWRDALRLQLWRITGSTVAWLAPEMATRKRKASHD